MARRRRRIARRGAPYIRANAVYSDALPPTHESVRRFLPVTLPRASLSPVRWRDLPPARRAFSKARAYRKLGALAIRVPRKVDFCIRRKARREVLFALGVGGSSGGMRGKRFRRTQDSQYRC